MIKAGKLSFSCKIDANGHFEKGRWVDNFTLLFDQFRDEGLDEKEPTFEITLCYDVPVFRKGAVIRWEKGEYRKIVTQSELGRMFPHIGNPAADGPCCLPVAREV